MVLIASMKFKIEVVLMTYIHDFFSSTIQLNIFSVIVVALLYIVIHNYRHKPFNRFLDIYLNYIPVLTHEFGHILFNKLSNGKAKDLVIVASPRERAETSQQGYAITQSTSRIGQAITTFGGYIMPPLMLLIGFAAIKSTYPSLFIAAYLFIFIYFVILTSRKLLPTLIILVLIIVLYCLFHSDNQLMMTYVVTFTYHFIIAVLLGEVLQSSWTIARLTFSGHSVTWDGSTLKDLTHIPTVIFSLIWIGINLFVVYLLITNYLFNG